jgi:hypothetical protein
MLFKKFPTRNEVSSMCGGSTIWGLTVLGLLLLATTARAEVTTADAENYCRQHVADMGGEVASKLDITGPTWHTDWDQQIFGDTITATFKKGSLVLSEQNSVQADHVLTILGHRAKGINVLIARYNDDANSIATLVIPMTETLSGPGIGCYTEWFIR